MELKHYFSILRGWLWLLIVAPLVAGGSSWYISQHIEPVYRASTTLLVSPTGESALLNYSSLLASERIAKTYGELVTKRPLLLEVIDHLQLNITPQKLAGMINVSHPTDTQLLEVQIENADPKLAVDIANDVASTFLEQHKIRQDSLWVYIEVIEPASLPAYKLRPRVYFNTLIGALAGILLSIAYIMVLDYLDDSFTLPEAVEKSLGVPICATIPSIRSGWLSNQKLARDGLVFSTNPLSPFSEAYRTLRTNIQFENKHETIRTLMVTSSLPQEGKTTVVANLGLVLAQSGKKVLLVDADLRIPQLHKVFNIPNRPGLSDLLLSDDTVDVSWLQASALPNLFILPAGSFVGDSQLPTPTELMETASLDTIISLLELLADVVIFDTPPILEVSDGLILAPKVSGSLLVIEGGRTSRADVLAVMRNLNNSKAKVFGAVLNRCAASMGYHYYDGGNSYRRRSHVMQKIIPFSHNKSEPINGSNTSHSNKKSN